jgi:hypothetical protein
MKDKLEFIDWLNIAGSISSIIALIIVLLGASSFQKIFSIAVGVIGGICMFGLLIQNAYKLHSRFFKCVVVVPDCTLMDNTILIPVSVTAVVTFSLYCFTDFIICAIVAMIQ